MKRSSEGIDAQPEPPSAHQPGPLILVKTVLAGLLGARRPADTPSAARAGPELTGASRSARPHGCDQEPLDHRPHEPPRRPSASRDGATREQHAAQRLDCGAAVAALTGIAGAFLLLGGNGGDDADYTCGADRLIAIDLSSQNRGDQQVQLATDVIGAHVFGAAVCGEHLTVIGAAAATPVLIDVADALPDLVGPNARARAQVARRHLDAIHRSAADAVMAALERFPEVATTSMPALYDAVAAHAEPGARIVLVTTGVHDEPSLTLNRPLSEGEGTDVAESMSWPTLPADATVSVLGVGQMDADVPAPGVLWPREVVAFNEVACAATKAGACDVLQVATSSEAQL